MSSKLVGWVDVRAEINIQYNPCAKAPKPKIFPGTTPPLRSQFLEILHSLIDSRRLQIQAIL